MPNGPPLYFLVSAELFSDIDTLRYKSMSSCHTVSRERLITQQRSSRERVFDDLVPKALRTIDEDLNKITHSFIGKFTF